MRYLLNGFRTLLREFVRSNMKKILLFTLAALLFSVGSHAQTTYDVPVITDLPDTTPPEPSVVYPMEVIQTNIIQEEIYEPLPLEVVYSPDVFGEMSRGLFRGSFAQNAAWNFRNNFGFSMGAMEGWYFIKNGSVSPFSDSTDKQSSSTTSLHASVFTNYAADKSAIHLEYGANYSFYPEQVKSTEFINHSVNAAYTYKLGNSARFNLRDTFSSYANDPLGDIFSANLSMGRLIAGSSYYDIIFTQRRYTRNSASASLTADVTGKGTNANIFGSYDNYWYSKDSDVDIIEDYYSALVGGGVSQRITDWLSLGSSYSVQLNDDLDDSKIHRVEVGNFQFNISPNVEVYAGGGVEFISNRNDKGYQTGISARAGINYSTSINSLYANYTRAMRSVSGSRLLLPSDTVTIGLGQPLGSRTNIRVMGYYQRSTQFNDTGALTAWQGMTSMEFLIGAGFVATANYSYRYQKNSINLLSSVPYAERQTVSVGLQYVWPSGR